MGALKDIIDTVKDMDVLDAVKDYAKSKKYSSVAKMASDGIMQFPVLVTRSLPIDTLQMVTKALERNYATFVQVAVTMNSTMDISKTKNPSEFIRKFHQNLNGRLIDTNDVMKAMTDSYNCLENNNLIFMSAVYEGSTGNIAAKNREQLIDLMEHVRSDILNNKYIPKSEVIYNFRNPELSAKYNALKEANGTTPKVSLKDRLEREKFEYQKTQDRVKQEFDQQKFIQQTQNAENREKAELDKFMYQQKKDQLAYATRHDDVVLAQNVLKDNDVKKANELIATTLHIRVKQINEQNEDVGLIDFIIGIKATMHPIRTEEMVLNMVSACRNNNRAFNFLRWTTGEISFFKDFLFNIKDMKDDVSGRSSGASPWWIALKRRKALSKLKDNIFTHNKILPNTTIVLSIEEIEQIKSEYGFDLFNPMFVNKIMQTYFLLGFVIVDSSAQIVHFMFDGRNGFESVSFSGLEKENSTDERKFKEMLKAINRN